MSSSKSVLVSTSASTALLCQGRRAHHKVTLQRVHEPFLPSHVQMFLLVRQCHSPIAASQITHLEVQYESQYESFRQCARQSASP
jgi:hypothetical protein